MKCIVLTATLAASTAVAGPVTVDSPVCGESIRIARAVERVANGRVVLEAGTRQRFEAAACRDLDRLPALRPSDRLPEGCVIPATQIWSSDPYLRAGNLVVTRVRPAGGATCASTAETVWTVRIPRALIELAHLLLG